MQATFGVRLPVAGPLASPESVVSTALVAERLGYSTAWVHDFVVWDRHLDRVHLSCGSAEAVEIAAEAGPLTFYEPLTTLSFVAGATSQIRLGVAVLCLPTRNPVITAKQVATLDQLSAGRVDLGVGVGAPKSIGSRDFEVLGVSRANKYERTQEYLRAMKALWSADGTYQGSFVSFKDASVPPKPAQAPSPPIWFGGSGERALTMVGTLGDGWLPGRVAPSEYRSLVAVIEEHAMHANRDPQRVKYGLDVFTSVSPTKELAEIRANKTIETLTARGGFATTKGQSSFKERALIGGPELLGETVSEYVSAGVQHFELKFVYHSIADLHEQLELFAATILSEFS